MRSSDTFKEWSLHCPACDKVHLVFAWASKVDQEGCPDCHGELFYVSREAPRFGQAPGIAGDELPVGYAARHGVCHPDGTPRRFDSKTELKRALNEAGLTIDGDTPKPYKVQWSGKRKEDPKPATIVKE